MGAFYFVQRRLRALVGELPLRYARRPGRGGPAEGFGDEEEIVGRPAQGVGDTVDDAPSTDALEPLGEAAVACRLSSGEDDARAGRRHRA